MVLQESVVKKAINYAKNNKGKLLAGAAGLAALGGAAYYAKEHGGLENTFNQLKDKFTGHGEPAAPAAPKPAAEKPVPKYTGNLKDKMVEAAKNGDTATASKFAKKYKEQQMKAEQPTSTADTLKRKMMEAFKKGDAANAGKYAKELETVKTSGAGAIDNSKVDTTGVPDVEPKYKFNPNVPAYKANWRNLRIQ